MGDPVTAALIIGTGVSVYSAYSGAQAAKKEDKYNAKVTQNNIKYAKEKAKDIVAQGAVDAKTLESDALRFADDQLLGFSAGNIDVASGVTVKATEDTARTAAADIITNQHNVKRDVWATEVGIAGMTTQSELDKIRARNAEKAANLRIASTILTTGARFA